MIGPMLTPREVACQARVTVRSLHNYWRAGRGPRRTCIGGRVFVQKDHFQAWIDACTEDPMAHRPNQADAV